MSRRLADWLNTKGNQTDDAGHQARAIRLYEMSAKADPTWSTPHFNLGLQAKFAANWQQSLEHNQRAVQLDPSNQGSWWNLGIAATALHDWPQARQAWRNAGIEFPKAKANGPGPHPPPPVLASTPPPPAKSSGASASTPPRNQTPKSPNPE